MNFPIICKSINCKSFPQPRVAEGFTLELTVKKEVLKVVTCSFPSSVRDIQVLAFLTIPWFTKSVTSWWVTAHETGCISQCLIQKKFGNINFSWVPWMVLLIWHYNNIYSGLKCVLFFCKLENSLLKRFSLDHFWETFFGHP